MNNRWSDNDAGKSIKDHSRRCDEDLALRTYSSRLLGTDEYLVLHGGGNSSVKSTFRNILGEEIPAIYVKASGWDMATIEPEGHVGLDLDYLMELRDLDTISDEDMLNELRTHMFNHKAATPSIEALMHAFIPKKFIDHTHADAILALTNQVDGESKTRDALGDDVLILPYVKPGFKLAKAVASAYGANRGAKGIVLMHHGLITWGDTAKKSYDAHIELVAKAENYLGFGSSDTQQKTNVKADKYTTLAPVLRGLLANTSARKYILRLSPDTIMPEFKGYALTPPVTTDHLIRTKPFPLWVDAPAYDDLPKLREQLQTTVTDYVRQYEEYIQRNTSRMPDGISPLDPAPRVVMLPGLGVVCSGEDVKQASVAQDITEHTLHIKANIAKHGQYKGLSEVHLFDMEYLPMQHAKLAMRVAKPLDGHIAIVTGAAGAIGAGICRGLLENGCHVAVTDIPGERLDSLVTELRADFGGWVIGTAMDVTDSASVKAAIDAVLANWGGLDIVVHCAGVAHVSTIADMDIEAFQRLEKINIEGTLNILKQAAPIFEAQNTGGDVVLISTKNVFAPGASFGAYSATKAASHQLGRIASLEFAKMGVRVNMVSPDAVFSDETGRKSGLWQMVGPERMKARGLDEKGLEDYYRDRNLLKLKVTAEHCANAVLFFVTHQTPTTGATIPVDGGLPDATPR